MIKVKLNFHSSDIFHYLLKLIFILTIINERNISLACPSNVCVCKWKSGKQTVECGGQLLSEIPDGMDPGTQILNFSGNSLQVLRSERFLRMDLINLQKIYLSRNQLIKIHEKAFRGLSNLVELDLSDNMLQHIPTETFQDYQSLMRLSLSNNPIREIKTGSFRYLSFLTTLEINNCQIEKIEDESFIGMDNLEWLRLDGNRIKFIQGNHILPKALHGISLQNNRWTCDCRLTDVHSWLINYNTPQIEEPKCIDPPRLKGKIIKLLKKNELACLPEVIPQSSYTEIVEGFNISLPCTVRAIPEAKVYWIFNGQLLTNNDSLLEALHLYYYTDESGTAEKHSEVFIYNVGPENNGTFSCIGQNIAGVSQTNYTLRVIIKKPPIINKSSFSKDYMNIIIASGGGAGIIFIIILCFVIVKCHMKKSKKNKRSNSDTSTSEAGILKCPSIINDEDLVPKSSKENGVMIGNTMKQSFMMYVPAPQSDHLMDSNSMQLSNTPTLTPSLVATDAHPTTSLSNQYFSPQSSIRSFAEKNPDLINDAESVQNKIKNTSEYETNEYRTGSCNVQAHFDNYYQLPKQFSSQIIKANTPQRLPFVPTLTKVQDRFTHDFSNNHPHKGQTMVSNQQNYYRTLPHNRGHNKFIASAANPGARYSLEAEFLQRSSTPTYDKYMHAMRFTADGYTMHPVQYPSPPEGYKGDYPLPDSINSGQSIYISNNFQHWPSCLPGYHTQSTLRHPTPSSIPSQTILSNASSQSSQTEISQHQEEHHHQQQPPPLPSSSVASVQVGAYSNNIENLTTSPSTFTNEIKKRCVSAQTTELNPATIYECDEDYENSKLRHLSSPLADSPDEGYVGDSQEGSDI